MSYQPARTRRGFTMIEILIILGIMGIIVTVSMARSTRIISGWRVDAASRAIADELQAAFSLVGRNRKPLVLTVDKSKVQLRLMSRSGADTFRLRALGPTTEYKLRGSDLTVYPATSPTTLEIYPPGLASDSLSITIKKDGVARRIRMLRGGLVQICKTGLNTQC
ncbi:MAG TPA: prepilin-type N-terminal cleavage/methylation domain-containing protein [Gemmatimonadaceae bacterium]